MKEGKCPTCCSDVFIEGKTTKHYTCITDELKFANELKDISIEELTKALRKLKKKISNLHKKIGYESEIEKHFEGLL